VRNRPNLEVALGATATRLIIDDMEDGDGLMLKGVEFMRDGRTHKVAARKEVVLSAGAVNSPKLLMLSGIGEESQLRRLGIDVSDYH
jgi:choline dehydrogenase